MDIKSKLTSRKFWLACAAMLASIAEGIMAYFSGNEQLAIAASVCFIVSAAIYQFCEAYVDAASVKSNTTTTTVSASSASKELVQSLLTKNNDGQAS